MKGLTLYCKAFIKILLLFVIVFFESVIKRLEVRRVALLCLFVLQPTTPGSRPKSTTTRWSELLT